MSGNTIGKLFSVTGFGESHGPAIGCIVDGCPPGMPLSEADIQPDLDRRKPGTSRHTTQRREADEVQILSGVFEGKTTGTPIGLIIYNTDQRSKDYSEIAQSFRPGHADYTYNQKYGIRDYRGGGRSSARETAMRVAAGAIAKKYLRQAFGIQVRARIRLMRLRATAATSPARLRQGPECGARYRRMARPPRASTPPSTRPPWLAACPRSGWREVLRPWPRVPRPRGCGPWSRRRGRGWLFHPDPSQRCRSGSDPSDRPRDAYRQPRARVLPARRATVSAAPCGG